MCEYVEAPAASGDILKIPKKIKSYDLLDIMASGGTAVVVSLMDVRQKDIIAAKVMKRPETNTQAMKALERELRIGLSVDCPYLVACIDVVYLDDVICVLMERVEGTSLTSMIIDNQGSVRSNWKKIFWQMCCGVQYLHGRGFAHRDLKLENFIIDDELNVKLCDYGVMCTTGPDVVSTTLCGTVPYLCPEIIRQKGYCAMKADMWALGIVLYGLVTGCFPWKSRNTVAMYREILGGVLDVDRLIGDSKTVIMRCCDPNPDTRATIDDILAMTEIQLATVQQVEKEKVMYTDSVRKLNGDHMKRYAGLYLQPRRGSLMPPVMKHAGTHDIVQRTLFSGRVRRVH